MPPCFPSCPWFLSSFAHFLLYSSFTSSHPPLKATFCSTQRTTVSSGGTSLSVPASAPIGWRTSSVAPGTNSRSPPRMLWGRDASVRSLKQRHMGKVGHTFMNKESQTCADRSIQSFQAFMRASSLPSSTPAFWAGVEMFDGIQVWTTQGHAWSFPCIIIQNLLGWLTQL